MSRLLFAGLLLSVCPAFAAENAGDPVANISDDARIDIRALRQSETLPVVTRTGAGAGTNRDGKKEEAAGQSGPWWRSLTGTDVDKQAGKSSERNARASSGAKFSEADSGSGNLNAETYSKQVSGGFELLKMLFLVGITFVCILFIWEWLRGRSVGEYREVPLGPGGAIRPRVAVPQPPVPGAPPRSPRSRSSSGQSRKAAPRVPPAPSVQPLPRAVRKTDEAESDKADKGWAEEAFAAADAAAAAKSKKPGGTNDWDSWLSAGAVGWGGYTTAEAYDPEADDPLAASSLYMSFGLHDQAASLLLEKIAEFPKRVDLRVALLQAYYKVENERAYMRHFSDLLKTNMNIKDTVWQDIADWGSELMPDKPVFRSENAAQARDLYGSTL